jgi:hypothetical protein
MSLIKTYKDQPVYKPSALAYDYTGAKYGDLTIMHAIGVEGAHTMWRAKCRCGTEVKVRSHQLANGVGKITSCGKCRNLPRYNLMELPYSLVDDNQKPEQLEIPLDKEVDALVKEVDNIFDTATSEKKTYDVTNEELVEFTAWDVARGCCYLLDTLDDADRIKALSLVKVQLGYDL